MKSKKRARKVTPEPVQELVEEVKMSKRTQRYRNKPAIDILTDQTQLIVQQVLSSNTAKPKKTGLKKIDDEDSIPFSALEKSSPA